MWVFALCVALGACSDGATRVEVTEQAVMGQIGPVGPVLAQAERDFLGEAGFGGIGSDAGMADGGIGSDAGVAYGGGAVGAIAVGLRRRDDLGRGLQLYSRVFAEHSELSATLPDGIGVLTDPMQVEIRTDGVGGEVSLGRAVVLPGGGRVDHAAGIGLAWVAARVHLQSALIERPSQRVMTLPYLLLTGRYDPLHGPTLAGEMRVYDPGQTELRLGLVQAF